MMMHMREPATKTQLVVMFLFVTIAFILVAARTEHNARANQHTNEVFQKASYNQCLSRNINVDRLNALYKGFIKIEKKNPFAKQSPAAKKTVEERIVLYKANLLTRINCGSQP